MKVYVVYLDCEDIGCSMPIVAFGNEEQAEKYCKEHSGPLEYTELEMRE